jgi:type IX secretion system PorP/SprF family membrane protein
MKTRFRLLFIALFTLVLFNVRVAGQDMNYSQYFSTPLYYNPAFTGVNTGVRARFLFRNQWPALPSPFKSYYFSADLGDRNLPGSGGIGLLINQDTPGPGTIRNFGAALTVGVRIPISELMVSQVGIKAGLMQRTINWGDLVFTDQLSGKYGNIFQTSFVPPDENRRTVADFGVGGLLQFMNPQGNVTGNIGLSVDHIFQPDVSFLSNGTSEYPRKYVGLFDLIIDLNPSPVRSSFAGGGSDPVKIHLGSLYQSQGGLNSLQLGANILKFNIYLGAWYKTTLSGVINSSIALTAGYRYNFYNDMNLKFMYSYDLQVSKSLQGTGGAHEISLVLEFESLSLFGGGGGGYFPGGRRGNGVMECPAFY